MPLARWVAYLIRLPVAKDAWPRGVLSISGLLPKETSKGGQPSLVWKPGDHMLVCLTLGLRSFSMCLNYGNRPCEIESDQPGFWRLAGKRAQVIGSAPGTPKSRA
jgi:hypothetical protein